MSDRQSVAGKRHFHGLEGSREYQSRRRCSFSLRHSSISRRSAISVSTARARAASATLKACWAELSGAVVVGLARSWRRRTVEPPHPHRIEEPAETPDLGRQSVPPRLDGDVVGVERGLRIDRLGRQDRLRLNRQIGRARVEGALRCLGGATARKRDGHGER